MMMREIYQFVSDLEQNNDKTWFGNNRDRYESTRSKFLYLTEVLINEIRSFDPEIGFLEPKNCMFRIHRDIRFSNNKAPFKTNYGSYIARGGRSGGNPGYYFQVQANGQSFLSAGIYMPDAEKLKAIRNQIYEHPEAFLEIIHEPDFQSRFALFADDKLKTAPNGYPKDWEHIDLLRYKSYAPFRMIPDEELYDPSLVEHLVEDFSYLHRFNQFLYEAIFK
jgi:uncharacterized protein (TIGR02453 family)